MARILFSPNGAPKRSCFKFFAKTRMAAAAAFSLAIDNASFDKEGNNKRL